MGDFRNNEVFFMKVDCKVKINVLEYVNEKKVHY